MTQRDLDRLVAERLAAWIADGLPEDVAGDFAHQRELARRRARYHADPDKALASRQRQAASLLRRAGCGVCELPALPWDTLTQNRLLQELARQARAQAQVKGGEL